MGDYIEAVDMCETSRRIGCRWLNLEESFWSMRELLLDPIWWCDLVTCWCVRSGILQATEQRFFSRSSWPILCGQYHLSFLNYVPIVFPWHFQKCKHDSSMLLLCTSSTIFNKSIKMLLANLYAHENKLAYTRKL